MRKQYSTFHEEKIAAAALMVAIMLLISAIIGSYCCGEQLATCWIMCKPGSYVTIRATPEKDGAEHGRLDCGDSFRTDGETKDGWISCCEGEGGWVYCGYVVTEQPEKCGERYVCVAKKQVACRRWMAGPQLEGRAAWMKNGEFCEVFLMADGWAVTNRGYIKSEWLEVSVE